MACLRCRIKAVVMTSAGGPCQLLHPLQNFPEDLELFTLLGSAWLSPHASLDDGLFERPRICRCCVVVYCEPKPLDSPKF